MKEDWREGGREGTRAHHKIVHFKVLYISVGTIHRCIDASRYLSRDSYHDTVCKYRDTLKKKKKKKFVV